MRIICYSEARNGLKSVLDGVENNADITIITRRDGGDAVVMSMAHYQSMAETFYLLPPMQRTWRHPLPSTKPAKPNDVS